MNAMKEKLIFCFWKKLNEENRDIAPVSQGQLTEKPNGFGNPSNVNHVELELDGETVDSSSNCNNTPKSKTLVP